MRKILIPLTFAFAGVASAESFTRLYVASVTTTDLGTLGGANSTALDINDQGEIVGWADTESGVQHAFFYQGGLMEDIGASAGPGTSVANSINYVSRVVGTYTEAGRPHAFVWDNGSLRFLKDFYAQGCRSPGSEAFAIGETNYMVGRIFCDVGNGGRYEAVRWQTPDAYVLLDHTGGGYHAPPFVWNSVAYDINRGITATGRTKDIEQMVRWRNTPPGRDTILPLPAGTYDPGFPDDGARAINNEGAVVGRVQRDSDGTWRAYYWSGPGTTAIDLGTLPGGKNSYAADLNELSMVVGTSDAPLTFGSLTVSLNYAFIQHPDFGMVALPLLAGPHPLFAGCEAHAVNERLPESGLVQVVGYCFAGEGARHAVRWDVTVGVEVTDSPRPEF